MSRFRRIRTSAANRQEASAVHLTAFLPSLIHCSGVPRPLWNFTTCRAARRFSPLQFRGPEEGLGLRVLITPLPQQRRLIHFHRLPLQLPGAAHIVLCFTLRAAEPVNENETAMFEKIWRQRGRAGGRRRRPVRTCSDAPAERCSAQNHGMMKNR